MSRPVQPQHLLKMAERLSTAAQERAYAVVDCADLDDPAYLRAVARHERRWAALERLTRALQRRLDGPEGRR